MKIRVVALFCILLLCISISVGAKSTENKGKSDSSTIRKIQIYKDLKISSKNK